MSVIANIPFLVPKILYGAYVVGNELTLEEGAYLTSFYKEKEIQEEIENFKKELQKYKTIEKYSKGIYPLLFFCDTKITTNIANIGEKRLKVPETKAICIMEDDNEDGYSFVRTLVKNLRLQTSKKGLDNKINSEVMLEKFNSFRNFPNIASFINENRDEAISVESNGVLLDTNGYNEIKIFCSHHYINIHFDYITPKKVETKIEIPTDEIFEPPTVTQIRLISTLLSSLTGKNIVYVINKKENGKYNPAVLTW